MKAKINQVSANLLIDTGAAVTIISQKLYDEISCTNKPPLRKPSNKVILKTADNNVMDVSGLVTLQIEITGTIFTWEAYVAPIQDDALIGFDFFVSF